MRNRVMLAIILGFAIEVFVLFGPITIRAKQVRGVSNDTIKIGLIADMTGPVTAVTVPMANGVKNYFKYINEEGGIFGRKIRVFHEDDRYSVPNTFAAFKKLIYKDKILTAILITQTTGIIALMPHYEKERLPIISVSTARVMTEPVKRYIFTVKDTYENGTKVAVEYIMKDLMAKKPVIGIVRSQHMELRYPFPVENKPKHRYPSFQPPWMDTGKNLGNSGDKSAKNLSNYQ